MAVTAALVKELRERTGAGMMECKKALTENGGDIEATIEAMRKSGQAKAAKKAGRIAADGVVVIRIAEDGKRGVVLEVNSETDFVAKDAGFQAFADGAAAQALASDVQDVAELAQQPMPGTDGTVDQAREALISKIGENIQLRRLVRYEGASGRLISYRHGVRIGVVVEVEGGDEALGKDLAMHIAASNPMCVDASGVAPEALEKEKDIFRVQALQSGKPEAIVEKMIEGRVRKYPGRGDPGRPALRQEPGADGREAAEAGRRQGDALQPHGGGRGHPEARGKLRRRGHVPGARRRVGLSPVRESQDGAISQAKREDPSGHGTVPTHPAQAQRRGPDGRWRFWHRPQGHGAAGRVSRGTWSRPVSSLPWWSGGVTSSAGPAWPPAA